MEAVQRTTRDEYRRRILGVLVHIQSHLDGDLSLDELARVAHFSPFHFHRVFRGMVGESVRQHVRRLRLERAAHHLKHTSRSVTDIAFDAGYQAHESFTRSFRQAFGRSPSAFRADSGAAMELSSPASTHYSDDHDPVFEPLTTPPASLEVRIEDLPAMRVAFIRHVGPYDRVGETWERLMDWAGAECLFGPDTLFLGACFDDPEVTAPDRLRYDACVTVDAAVQPQGEVGIQTVAGGLYAAALHEGPYTALDETYAALLGRWFPAHDREPGDPPCLELYLNDPGSTEPQDLLTEVHVRVRN